MTGYVRALRRLLSVPSSPRLGLSRMERLLAGLGDPHRVDVRVVHVAGTNGKGSTVAFVDAVLRAHGVRTGRTTSPHLTCARERIVNGGEMIDEGRFVELEARVAKVASTMGDDPPTFFERVIAMAFLDFAEAGVEVAVVEVGLGGRLDATNVVRPRVTGVSRVSLDHTKWLGDRLDAVAREKAGIFKPGVAAWTVRQEPLARDALRARADEVGAPLGVADAYDGPTGLVGRYQAENAGLALALAGAAWPLNDAATARGLMEARWPGRMERVHASPPVWLDGAHNEAAMENLVAELDRVAPGPRAVVAGFTSGHDEVALGRALGRAAAGGPVFATQASAPRSLPAARVAEVTGGAAYAVDEALERALSFAAQEGGAVIVTGSLYLVGEARARFVDAPVDPVLPMF